MKITQCVYCKMPFQSYGSDTCLTCLSHMDECFIKVRDFLDEYPNADMYTVSEVTEVSVKMIMHLLKEERLLISDENVGNILLICESCKRPIKTGRLCESCRESLVKTMREKVGSAPVAPTKKVPKTDSVDRTKGVAKIDIDK